MEAAASSDVDFRLYIFLAKRGVGMDSILKMKEDKIDTTIIEVMTDDSLAQYLPIYGDRIAARRFCLDHSKDYLKEGQNVKKESLLNKLRAKMGIGTSEESEHYSPLAAPKRARVYLKSNKLAEKPTRKVKIGWIHNGKQVRKRNGGGTRTLDVTKKTKKAELLGHAKELFFPKGCSQKGSWEEFRHSIYDFQEAELDDDVSVGELYTIVKMGILRFYLHTAYLPYKNQSTEISTDFETESDTGNHVQSATQVVFEEIDELDSTSDVDILSDTVMFGPVIDNNANLDDTLLHDTNQIGAGDLDLSTNLIPQTIDTLSPPNTAPAENTHPLLIAADTVRSASVPSPQVEIVYVMIKLHRVKLMDEMISQFKDPAISTLPLKYSFIDEKGADAEGVSRDVYSAFWSEFLDCAAEGEEMRVPSLSPKWQEEEWKAIGRILAKGFKDHSYFPSRVAPAFIVALIFGEHSVSADLLFESLLLYLSQSERDLLSSALKEELLGDEKDELLDLMDRMGVTAVPTRDNLKAVIQQVAHKQIIQQPKYALDNISETAGETLREAFSSPLSVQKMYEDKKPTTRKILKLLDASPTTQAETQSLRFLQQFIRGLDEVGLRKFLRFVTGSDVICVQNIEIIFTPLDGLARRPVAHTCGAVLELPFTYCSYPELRAEIESILACKNSFSMDIV